MREVDFRAWLELRTYQGKPLQRGAISSRIGWVKAIERALPELGFDEGGVDEVHAAGRWNEFYQALGELMRDWHSNEAAAHKIAPKAENPSSQISNAHGAARLYGYFADGRDPSYSAKASEGEAMTDEQILARFTKKAEFAAWWETWPNIDREAFLRIVRLTHEAGLDWYHLKMTHEVRCGRKKIGAIDANEVFAQISGRAPYSYVRKEPDRDVLELSDDWIGLTALAEALDAAPEAMARFAISRDAYWPDEVNPDSPEHAEISANVAGDARGASQPTNLILYGPPGTGKTYATTAEAVRLCDRLAKDSSLLSDRSRRGELRERYDQLVDAGQIRLVTFHQNYAYEDFIEGLRPVTDSGVNEEGARQGAGFRLEPKRGIFREICTVAENARKNAGRSGGFDLAGRKFFKMSLGRAGVDDHIFDAAIEGNFVVLGWGAEVDWSDPRYDEWSAIFERWQQDHPEATGYDPNVVQMGQFRSSMKEGDLVIVSSGNAHFRAIGEVTGPYRFEPTETREYNHRRPVRWLLVPDEPLPVEMLYSKKFMMQSCYQLTDAQVKKDALSGLLPGAAARGGGDADQFVLIIDEINRANISKVFGELITLIEPDKRLGAGTEELTLQLPYSGDRFGVPANLHIVGTMNTADRSIALLDTALRRRFRFKELAPDTTVEAFQQAVRATGLPLDEMLDTINERIEYLIDREHRIGHAFFIGCVSKAAVDAVMRDKVIPLLQDYFFEDWGRVAAVLGERPDRCGGFLECRKLTDPTGKGGEPRHSWSVCATFAEDAYRRLTGKATQATQDPGSEASGEQPEQ